ncbi:hypothetical protein M6I34_17590 [Burkholderiaceae bacterium FT117]|uniref:hypothetical protein n=1 Tax=Zeimonas sediminis TaxID=2944268 RepID=UPI0023431DB8|nr:hypothetical protein [Zeimonas sediminis]MCM5572331.1 hypothetical protein [Zeimonas sediminis]
MLALAVRLCLPLAAVALLAGCIPAPYGPYYRPSYPDASAQAVKAWCGGQAGPPTGLVVSLADGLTMRVGAATATGAAPKAMLSFELAPGTTLRFLEDSVRVDDGAGSGRIPVRMSVASHARVAPTDIVDLPALSAVAPAALDAAGPGAVSITVGTGFSPGAAGVRPEVLRIEWPSIRWADGTVTRFAAVELKGRMSKSGWLQYRTDDETEALQARYARCRAETPQRNCAFLLDSYENGFTVGADGATLRGRLLVTEPAKPRLAAYLTMELPQLQAWRWSDPDVLLRDPRSGQSWRQPFGASGVGVRAQGLPLSTPLAAPAGASATASIEVPLGSAAGERYRLRLPPVEVNGRRTQPEAIELERRTMDGGLEPFNC